jgi:hypothetical protein
VLKASGVYNVVESEVVFGEGSSRRPFCTEHQISYSTRCFDHPRYPSIPGV